MYRYFIAYNRVYDSRIVEVGRREMRVKRKITSVKDLTKLEVKIDKEVVDHVLPTVRYSKTLIYNFILLED